MNKIKRFSENPYLNTNEITTSKKKVIIGKGNDVLLNQDTGELSTTNIITYKEVDNSQFIKLFTQNIGLMLNLTAAGNKAFVFLSWALQRYSISKDLVTLGTYELKNFLENTKEIKMSVPTLRRGLKELVNAQILANAEKPGTFYINPNFIFNGDRLRFITEIRRKPHNHSLSNTEQASIQGSKE